jgi:hypothetical protein
VADAYQHDLVFATPTNGYRTPLCGRLAGGGGGHVKRAEEWKWSSFHEYAGNDSAEQRNRCRLNIDRVRLPADENARI